VARDRGVFGGLPQLLAPVFKGLGFMPDLDLQGVKKYQRREKREGGGGRWVGQEQ
jgi:hypothetical protein